MSPSFWFSDEVWKFVEVKGHLQHTRLYLLIGEKEPAIMVSDTQKMHDLLLSKGFNPENLTHKLNPEGEHKTLLREEFKGIMEWLFNSN